MAEEKAKAAPVEEDPLESRVRELEVALRASQAAAAGGAVIAHHGGGVGNEVHPTWSQHDQELARAGKHPAQKK